MGTTLAPRRASDRQRSFEDLGLPLHDVTFCVVDLETTGGSPATCEITEVGAAKFRGGACLGTFQTLVNPGVAIPPSITVLTGITEAMVLPAPPVDAVLPTLLEFIGSAVIVGHNISFDVAFLNAALVRSGRSALSAVTVDTARLARRLVRDEVPDCRLQTLADRFRLPHRPRHRALDDTLATADLLHLLLERAAGLGVTGLDDLVALPTMAGHPQARKLGLTAGLPRTAGIYIFRDRAGRALYVGKASNLRSRVRSYFSTDERRKIGALLRETNSIDHLECGGSLEASVVELRLIQRLGPRFNRQGTRWRVNHFVKLTTNEPFPRLALVRRVRADGGFYLGPLPSARAARRVIEAVETALPLRRCTLNPRPSRLLRSAPCAPAQLGVSCCPCSGHVTAREYAGIVERTLRGLTVDPDALLSPLRHRLGALAAVERFEEAADMRDRAEALASALRRQRRLDGLRASGRVVLEEAAGARAELHDGRLVRVWTASGRSRGVARFDPEPAAGRAAGPGQLPLARVDPAAEQPLPGHVADELMCVAAWLDANAGRVRILHADAGLASPLPRLPSFAPRSTRR